MENNSVFKIKNLQFAYDTTNVINDVSFDIAKGKITTFMGANGCGKSTLFQLLTKNLHQNKGKITLQGEDIRNIPLKEFARKVAIVHQYNTTPDDLTVEDLVRYGRTPYNKFNQSDAERQLDNKKVERAMKITGILRYRDRSVGNLSGGQKQRVWIAMAIAQDTKIIFLDEPTTYLDVRYQLQILQLVKALNEKCGITIVMVLHDINQALAYSDEIIAFSPKGKVIAQGPPKEVIVDEVIGGMFKINLEITEIKGSPFVITV